MVVYDRSGKDYDGPSFPSNVVIKPCENIGREAYVILQHIVCHYKDLCKYTFFIPANWDSHRKQKVLEMCKLHGKHPFLPVHAISEPWEKVEPFVMEEWSGINKEDPNYTFVAKQEYVLSKDRPFGVWYKKNIPIAWKNGVILNGVFAVQREHVQRYPIDVYQQWFDEISQDGPNPELGHYWERVWYSLFS